MAQMKVFVSYSHKNTAFTQRLVNDLHQADAEVWVDMAGLTHGNFLQRIDEALAQCAWMVLVLTPDAIASDFVKDEVYSALLRVKQGYMRDVIPVLAAPCAPGTIPPQWDALHRYDATRGYPAALAGVLEAIGLSPVAATISPLPAAASLTAPLAAPVHPMVPTVPPVRFPPRLAQLGFAVQIINNVEVIIPPVCEVPAGEFLMGSDSAQDKDAFAHEKPQHWLTLPAFQIGLFPVTVAEYACFVRSGQPAPMDWQDQSKRLDHPVTNMSWRDAMAYVGWLAQVADTPWRLPTEAEWEKAARWDAATRHSRIYPWGDIFDAARCTAGRVFRHTTPVGTHIAGASPCGAQDMAGNVWEWASSLYKPYPYWADDGREQSEVRKTSWFAALVINEPQATRVLRGGSWANNPRQVRAANRWHAEPDSRNDGRGFRIACTLTGA